MKELGEYLKNTREANGVGLEEASVDIEIPEYELESIEEGNIKVFRDTLILKETIKKYAKYLGLDPQKIADDFNDFMFEHTSKISLEDIAEAQRKAKKEEEKKIVSPYTKLQAPRRNLKPLIMIACTLVVLMLLVIFAIQIIRSRKPIVDHELQNIIKESGVLYESTY